MVGGNAVRHEYAAQLVQAAMPGISRQVGAELDGLIDLGVGIGLMLPLIPSPAREAAHIV